MNTRVNWVPLAVLVVFGVILTGSNCFATSVHATSVCSYTPGTGASMTNPEYCLGPWDTWHEPGIWHGQVLVGIGRGGILTVEMGLPFRDGPGMDMIVYEIGQSVGGANDSFRVYISTDATDWYLVGPSPGDHSSFDISGVGSSGPFRYIRVLDTDTTGMYDGADIDAFDAMYPVPEPVTILGFGMGVTGVLGYLARRRMH